MVKNLPAAQEAWVQSQFWKVPWRREGKPTPVFLPGEFHGQRSLAGYSPWDRKESDITEQLTHTHSYSKGNIVVLKFLTGAKAPASHFDRYQWFNGEKKNRYDLSLQKVTNHRNECEIATGANTHRLFLTHPNYLFQIFQTSTWISFLERTFQTSLGL